MKKIYFIILSPILLILCAILLLFKILFRMKFYVIDSSRIGHLSVSMEVFLRKKKNDPLYGFYILIKPISNNYLLSYYEKILQKKNLKEITIFKYKHWYLIDNFYKLIFKKNLLDHINYKPTDIEFLLNTKPILNIKKDLNINFKFGLPKDAKWICIHNRDRNYLQKHYGRDMSYHNYRDYEINDLIPASNWLTKRGYYIIRVGTDVKKKIITRNKKIIDYSNHPSRNDESDIYFLSKCEFYLGSTSGIGNIPLIMNKPRYCINVIPLSSYYIIKRKEPVILKRLFDTKSRRVLSLSDIFKKKLEHLTHTEEYKKFKIRTISNSKKEILELAKEAVYRQNNKKKRSVKLNQNKLYLILKNQNSNLSKVYANPLGKHFIKKIKIK